LRFAQIKSGATPASIKAEDAMRTGINHLFIPGPTNVPERVRQSMNVPMQDHRAHDFGAPNMGIFRDLKSLFRTKDGHVLVFPASGTGSWEAAITNTLSPGDRVLMARHGQFSVLWAQMAERLGLDVELIDLPWGAGAPISEFARRLGADRKGEIKAVFVTHNETATGVTSDIAALRRVMNDAFHDALLFVDGVSSIGCLPFEMDEWGVDLAVTGSQKGLMMPPGLGILGVSPKAMKAAETAKMRRAYFEFSDQVKNNETGYFPYTPPVQLLHGLRAALDLMIEEGFDAVITRHHQDHDVRGLCTAGTHGREGLVTGGVQERDHAARSFNVVSTNVLGDTTRFTRSHFGTADVVQQRGLTMVHVAHDGDHRRTRQRRRVLL
jgi:alanine-glyoxylate transaminase/serine-glyoxylate transaminase/serine-pyruvate transaminase